MPWYDCVAVGKNKLSTMVKDICNEAGISDKTNHSLRPTGATTLFKANVPEKIIQNTTGHRSVEALHSYERALEDQQKASSMVLTTRDPNVDFTQLSTNKVLQQTSTKTESSFSTLFGQMHGCTIGTINVNFMPVTTSATTCSSAT